MVTKSSKYYNENHISKNYLAFMLNNNTFVSLTATTIEKDQKENARRTRAGRI
jgi:hypothetical protein